MKYKMNKVEGFNPYDHVETAKDRHGNDIVKSDGKPLQYLTTAAKVYWFRLVHPNGILKTTPVKTPEQEYGALVSFKASVFFAPGELAAEWTHQESVWDLADLDNAVSKVQTIAMGKALSKAGFGCEIELELGAISEGETQEDPVSEPVPESVNEPPKKKRGRPKKEEANLETEVESLLNAIENSIEEEAETPKEEVSEKIDALLAMKLVTTEKAPINIKKMDGMTLGEILGDHSNFGSLVKTRPNIRNAISDECAEALIYIEDHKM